jgi:hypothetical protein
MRSPLSFVAHDESGNIVPPIEIPNVFNASLRDNEDI